MADTMTHRHPARAERAPHPKGPPPPDTTTTPPDTTTPPPPDTTTKQDAPVQLAATPVTQPLMTPAGAKKAIHFAGPVVSGGKEYVQGQVVLVYRFDIDKSTGNFAGGTTAGTTLKFPIGTVFWKLIVDVTQAFDGTTPKLNIGTTPGGTDAASIALGSLANTETNILSTILPASGNIYVSLTGGPFTTGHAAVALLYLGSPAAPWN
jgi:hypothetical protein